MITINPKFQSLIPPLSAEELAQLETNIKADGCMDPLVTWRGVLLDGHNRYAICQRLRLPYTTRAVELPDDDAAQVWIIRNQFGRRNISNYTRALLALKLEPLVAAKAKENLVASGGDRKSPSRKSGCQNSDNPIVPIDTKKEIAKAAGVSHDTIAKCKVIEAKASEEVKAALSSGETSIHAEYKKLTVHVGQNSGEQEWYTPPNILDAARAVLGEIDCDPASSEIANRTVKAKQFFTQDDDGLKSKWGERVWLNPPYGQPHIALFADAVVSKVHAGEVIEAIVLVNNATETAWFQSILRASSAVCFPASRIKFLDTTGKPSGSPLQGQAILYLGGDAQSFVNTFNKFGACLYATQRPI